MYSDEMTWNKQGSIRALIGGHMYLEPCWLQCILPFLNKLWGRNHKVNTTIQVLQDRTAQFQPMLDIPCFAGSSYPSQDLPGWIDAEIGWGSHPHFWFPLWATHCRCWKFEVVIINDSTVYVLIGFNTFHQADTSDTKGPKQPSYRKAPPHPLYLLNCIQQQQSKDFV